MLREHVEPIWKMFATDGCTQPTSRVEFPIENPQWYNFLKFLSSIQLHTGCSLGSRRVKFAMTVLFISHCTPLAGVSI